MKKLKSVFLTSIALITSFASLQPMEPVEGLKLFIFNIQDYAERLTQDTGVGYKIITQSNVFDRCLKVLGLNPNNTLLDIRYHYELMQKKLLDHDGLSNVITKAYNQLILMISEIEKYQGDLQYLLGMSFEDLQSMEIENGDAFGREAFLKSKNQLIDRAIALLKKQQQEYTVSHQVSHQFGLPLILQNAFNLPANASPDVVDEHYKSYMQSYQNYSNNLIAQATMKTMPIKRLKRRLAEVEKVSKAYDRYVQKRGQK